MNDTARLLRTLHRPGKPLLLANVYDAITARAVGSMPTCRVLATASYSIAAAAGLKDEDLDLATSLRAVVAIAAVARELGKPLTVDLQDGYGDRLDEAVQRTIHAGAVGINIEDADPAGNLYSIPEAAERVRQAMAVAIRNKLPDFVINARTDTMRHGGTLEDAIARGRAYLAAGAFNVFVWGGPQRSGLRRAEVEALTEAFEGRLNVMRSDMKAGELTLSDLAELGVARCSMGPYLQSVITGEVAKAAAEFIGT
ncbi:hypothetical protein LTR91_017929 [Friedmanniomyces endolithicus]|uniref:Carboxyvinyl-carboxyphosphonate phosphorylmutase n=1 Tax=Friedmanniomyces endolithicus TaxID=329885 RepID=A0AAN6HFH6_9PEZI|nr:hypothetical protein LTR94_014384 [Friedmanniomyces endolithicus]KAK0779412.1 hypothetical protein LTR59_013191 [Friedmanniomyces endolithicus]KAK0784870.1 hypothetical protein LTR38_012515 [Friedmanniomyces endolithicus]KAK0790194.1 hypothetical protein LTR75_012124 [Friedmanniomyces endolithicus]KAK0853441.1 hypothetical protein LTS02_011983 [Friedmanniomyces endolithicus]